MDNASDSSTTSTKKPALVGEINKATVFKTPVTFSTHIHNYLGDQLFCGATVSGNTLIITINDDSPGNSPPAGTYTGAQITATYDNHSTNTATTNATIVYGGEQLIVTATVDDSTSPVGITLDVSEFIPGQNDIPVSFVVVKAPDGSLQLRWIENPVELKTVPLTAEPVDATDRPKPGGGGVSGPMGLAAP